MAANQFQASCYFSIERTPFHKSYTSMDDLIASS